MRAEIDSHAPGRSPSSSPRAATAPAPSRSLPFRLRIISFRRNDDARVRLDPGHVVVDGDAAGRVLGDDLERPAQSFVDDRAGKGDDAVLNLDAHARARRPFELVDLRQDRGFDFSVRMRARWSRASRPAAPFRRSERETTPTSVSPRSTGSRLMRWRIIRSTASLSSDLLRSSGHRGSSLRRPCAPCSCA